MEKLTESNMFVEWLQEDNASISGPPSKSCPLSKLTGFQADILFVVVHLDGTTIVGHETDERRVGPVFRPPRTYYAVRRDDHPTANTALRAENEHECEKPAEEPLEAHA
jgi:hypothetical protein